jgi:hypothetical protein
MPDKPRGFQEVVAAQTPDERERLAAAEAFKDVLVRNPFQQDVTVIEDRDGTGEWRVEYFDDERGGRVNRPDLRTIDLASFPRWHEC